MSLPGQMYFSPLLPIQQDNPASSRKSTVLDSFVHYDFHFFFLNTQFTQENNMDCKKVKNRSTSAHSDKRSEYALELSTRRTVNIKKTFENAVIASFIFDLFFVVNRSPTFILHSSQYGQWITRFVSKMFFSVFHVQYNTRKP